MTSSTQQAGEVKPDLDFDDELEETQGTEVIRQALRPRKVGEPKRPASGRQPVVNPRSTPRGQSIDSDVFDALAPCPDGTKVMLRTLPPRGRESHQAA